ncbi:MAG: 2-C-methyl-D-erythritol 2,4-cyclodiphosphate synthase [Lutisporaceae bacterium]
MIKIGNGYDVHHLVENRGLIIGGVSIPYYKGLLGHSDADVLVHAIMDALLGACGERDIGKHFPDTDDSYKGISSLKLLGRVKEIIREKGYRVGNIDSIIVAQAPKMAPYIEQMKKNIGDVLDISEECINIKATTTEGLGFEGKGEGIASYAVACLYKLQQ